MKTEMCDKIFKKMYIKEETEDTSCPDQSTTKNEDADEQGLCSFFDSSCLSSGSNILTLNLSKVIWLYNVWALIFT